MTMQIKEDALNTRTLRDLMERFRVTPTQMAALINKHDIDPDVFEKLMEMTLDQYGSVDMFINNAAFQREVETVIEEACEED